jgi:16S rRNA (cytosine1402-N4)-methyltransferase
MISLINELYMADEVANAGANYHVPVLLEEVVFSLQPAGGKLILDGTTGGGGHTKALLDAGASVIACDQDPEALAEISQWLEGYSDRLRLVESNFADIAERLPALGVQEVDGILLDLGVSSHQLNTPERGFSFQADGPLDMRMSPRIERTAAELVNEASPEELTKIFFEFGEEPAAKRVALRLVKARMQSRIVTTQDLVEAIEVVLPRRGPKNPATKIFQALRIAVNGELSALTKALPSLSQRIKLGGRMAIITFHSLEDRIVKRYFREVSQEWIDRPEWPAARRNPLYAFRLITPRPVGPSKEEMRRNPRARSAKLRVIERINSHES